MSLVLDKLFVREFEKKDQSVLHISQSEIGDVGCVVWDAAIVLASFLETPGFEEMLPSLESKRVIELGAGTGIVGLQAASLGAECLITDLPDFMPLIDLNIKNNQSLLHGNTSGKSLIWGQGISEFLPAPDLILIADCIYYEESIEPLVKTLTDLAGPETSILCCFEERTTGNKPYLQKKFFQLIEEQFLVTEIPLEKQHELFRSEDIHIMLFKYKS